MSFHDILAKLYNYNFTYSLCVLYHVTCHFERYYTHSLRLKGMQLLVLNRHNFTMLVTRRSLEPGGKSLLLNYLKDLQLAVLSEGNFSLLKSRVETQNAFCLLYAVIFGDISLSIIYIFLNLFLSVIF